MENIIHTTMTAENQYWRTLLQYYDKIVASTKPIWENVDRTGWHQIFEQPKSVFLHLTTSRQVKWHALYWK